MKLYEVKVSPKHQAKMNNPNERERNHLVIEETVKAAKTKVQTEFGKSYSVGKPNMIADFNPK